MKLKFRALAGGAAGLVLCLAAAGHADPVPNFRLLDTGGRSHELHRAAAHPTIALIAVDPAAPDWAKPAAALGARLAKAGGAAWIVAPAAAGSVNPAPDAPPVLLDPAHIVTTALGLARHGDTLLVDSATWTARYRGPLGDPDAETGAFAALNGAQAGATPGAPLPLDCFDSPPGYADTIAPILAAKCATCHRPGDTAPFAFDSHRRAAGWAAMVEEVILTDRMPPWHADPAHGPYENDRSLTPGEKRALVSWIRAGAPRGEGDDPLHTLVTARTGAWRMGEPDVVLPMPEPFDVPAEGVIEYQLFTVPTGFTEDTWIRGIEVLPGAAEVVHHALVFIEYPEDRKHLEPRVMGGAGGYFAGFVPGAEPRFYPEGTGKFVPAGANFIFQMHYVTTGRPHRDQTRLGLHLLQEPPAKRLVTDAAFNPAFEIPPGHPEFPVSAETRARLDVTLHAMAPHMHYRGKHVRYTAHYPDGAVETLLSVPDYRFDWQTQYRLAEPRRLPRGTRIVCEGAFDNSPANPYNPDPAATVRFGDQTYEEMFIGYLEYAVDHAAYVRQMEQRRERMAQDRQSFASAARPESSDPPMTPEELLGTLWEGDQFKFRFLEDGVFVVNDLIRGKYRVENHRVYIDVVGEHFELDIIGKGLYFNGSYAITRLE